MPSCASLERHHRYLCSPTRMEPLGPSLKRRKCKRCCPHRMPAHIPGAPRVQKNGYRHVYNRPRSKPLLFFSLAERTAQTCCGASISSAASTSTSRWPGRGGGPCCLHLVLPLCVDEAAHVAQCFRTVWAGTPLRRLYAVALVAHGARYVAFLQMVNGVCSGL